MGQDDLGDRALVAVNVPDSHRHGLSKREVVYSPEPNPLCDTVVHDTDGVAVGDADNLAREISDEEGGGGNGNQEEEATGHDLLIGGTKRTFSTNRQPAFAGMSSWEPLPSGSCARARGSLS